MSEFSSPQFINVQGRPNSTVRLTGDNKDAFLIFLNWSIGLTKLPKPDIRVSPISEKGEMKLILNLKEQPPATLVTGLQDRLKQRLTIKGYSNFEVRVTPRKNQGDPEIKYSVELTVTPKAEYFNKPTGGALNFRKLNTSNC